MSAHRVLTGHEILSIANDTSTGAKENHRIVLSNRGGSIMLMEIDKKGALVPIWNKAAYKIPKTVAFSKEGDLIYVFGLWDGIMYVVSSEFGLKFLI